MSLKQIGQNALAFCPTQGKNLEKTRGKPDQLTQAGQAPVPHAGDGASAGLEPLFLKSVA
jgi:hypothetical protein